MVAKQVGAFSYNALPSLLTNPLTEYYPHSVSLEVNEADDVYVAGKFLCHRFPLSLLSNSSVPPTAFPSN